jgi:hypothetical protein
MCKIVETEHIGYVTYDGFVDGQQVCWNRPTEAEARYSVICCARNKSENQLRKAQSMNNNKSKITLAVFVMATLLWTVVVHAQGIPSEIAKLQAQVAALQSQVNNLQSQLAAVQSNNALKLGPFVDVDANPENGVAGPNIKFSGANIHILSGSNATDDNLSHGGSLTGLGNLIIGYDELSTNQVANRGGSHNLVLGRFNAFTSSAFGGLVGGEFNTISAEEATVLAGRFNTASNLQASVLGGQSNTASGFQASVLAGQANTASGIFASVSGGLSNTASNLEASVSSGVGNTASARDASVLGGGQNTASGFGSVVLGGQNVTDNMDFSIAPQPPFP